MNTGRREKYITVGKIEQVLAQMQKLHDEINAEPVDRERFRSIVFKIRKLKCTTHPDHAFLKNFYCQTMNLVNAPDIKDPEQAA